MDITPKYLSVRQASLYTGMSQRTIHYARGCGELPYIKKGQRVLLKTSDLDAWMDRDRVDVTADIGRLEAVR